MKENELEVVRVKLIKEAPLISEKKITNSDVAVEVIKEYLGEMDREYFCILNLDTRGKCLNFNVCSIGTVNMSLVSPREFLKSAILSNAASVIAVHNHPSGDSTPSRTDINTTKQLVAVCKLCGIDFLDHIIIGEDIYSFRKGGLLDCTYKLVLDDEKSNIHQMDKLQDFER